MSSIQLAKWAVGFLLPIALSFIISEFFGWTNRTDSGALTEAIWDAFKNRRPGGILISIITAVLMAVGGAAASHWMEDRLNKDIAAMHIVAAGPSGSESIVCAPHSLLNRMFSGSVKGNDVTFRITDVRRSRSGASFKYTLMYGGDLRTDGVGTFDAATCTVRVPEFLSPGHIVKSGAGLTLVATEPLWTLTRHDTR